MSEINQPINESAAAAENQPRSTSGMTTKVVKGSIWTLAGSVLPMLVSLIATPFTIRFLGSEGYGVLILVGLIPTYFSFADFGMGIASTKFGSEAYGEGDPEKEGQIVRTAALIALCTSLVFAVPIFLFSWPIVTAFNVPEHFRAAANVALKITSVSFVIGILSSVVNTPMLARLRMDLNTISGTVPKILMAVVTPVVLYLGGGVAEAVWVGLAAAMLGFVGILFFSGRLLPQLLQMSITSAHFRPLAKFGGSLVIGGIAALLLINLEKIVLTRLVSVQSLAFYSVAFTFAAMATIYSTAIGQSLVPAFSQLLAPGKKQEFDGLFARGMRLNLILLLPMLTFLFVIAKPFFAIWAGEEFGQESTFPFYILLFGLFFNILASIPYATILAKGRTDIFAKLYWIELAIYAVVVVVMISWLGIAGAAAAWSIRVILDAFIIIWFSKRVADVPLAFVGEMPKLALGMFFLFPVFYFAVAIDNFSPWLLFISPVCFLIYSLMIWRSFLESAERTWIKSVARNLLKFA